MYKVGIEPGTFGSTRLHLSRTLNPHYITKADCVTMELSPANAALTELLTAKKQKNNVNSFHGNE